MIQPQHLRDWLESHDAHACVGYPGNDLDCPLARLIRARGWPQAVVRLAREQAAQYRRESGPHLVLACLALVLHALVLAQVRDPEGDR